MWCSSRAANCKRWWTTAATPFTQAARKQGMRTLGQSGWEKVKAGHTTLEEVLRVVTVVEK
jgi:type II secretory ATPase GspE/PulE/Tfp pilus assembly ATPase PilB-like protein